MNVTEHGLVRTEMLDLKSCITTYVGFVLGGAAAGVFALASAVSSKNPPGSQLALGIASEVGALIATLVLLLLSYKFVSHNRYAGYCKLLAHERVEAIEGTRFPADLICWELCMDRLRDADGDNSTLLASAEELTITGVRTNVLTENLKAFTGPFPQADRGRFFRGIGAYLSAPWRSSSAGAWRFPLYVCTIFVMLTSILTVIAAHFLQQGGLSGGIPNDVESASISLLFFAIAGFWLRVISSFWVVMRGSGTVDAYCWKFLPIRAKLLSEMYPGSSYELIGVRESTERPITMGTVWAAVRFRLAYFLGLRVPDE